MSGDSSNGGPRAPDAKTGTDTVVQLPIAPGARLTLLAVQQVLRAKGGLLPRDPDILVALWPPTMFPPPPNLDKHLDTLLHRGYLRCVYVGREPHLTLNARERRAAGFVSDEEDTDSPPSEIPRTTSDHAAVKARSATSTSTSTSVSASTTAVTSTTGTTAAGTDEPQTTTSEEAPAKPAQTFELQVAVDTETERALLYRVAVVLLVLVGLTIMREWALFLYHL